PFDDADARSNTKPRGGSSGGPSAPSPLAGEGQGGGPTSRARSGSKVHKPHLDEMHGPESLPYRANRTLPAKPFGSTSKIIQPSNSRESGPGWRRLRGAREGRRGSQVGGRKREKPKGWEFRRVSLR